MSTHFRQTRASSASISNSNSLPLFRACGYITPWVHREVTAKDYLRFSGRHLLLEMVCYFAATQMQILILKTRTTRIREWCLWTLATVKSMMIRKVLLCNKFLWWQRVNTLPLRARHSWAQLPLEQPLFSSFASNERWSTRRTAKEIHHSTW